MEQDVANPKEYAYLAYTWTWRILQKICVLFPKS